MLTGSEGFSQVPVMTTQASLAPCSGGTELPPGAGALPSATASLGTEEALGLNPVTPQVTHEDGV